MRRAIFAFSLLTAFEPFDVYGPAYLSYANPGVLERVAERRLQAGWNLTGDWTAYDVLLGVERCELLDRAGWLIVDGRVLTVKVVDCEADVHAGQMAARGLLADTNREELTHLKGWLVLK